MKSDLSFFNTEERKNIRTEEQGGKKTKEQGDGLFRFRKFPVYQEAREFRKDLKILVKEKFPREEKFGLISQLFRALDSVLLNIAEGSEKYSDVEFSRFLNISLSSLNEVRSCLDIAFDDNYISREEYRNYSVRISSIYKQLKAFSSKVRKDSIRN